MARLTRIVALLVIAVLLAGCGNSSNNTVDEEFGIDPYPDLVNTSPFTFSGTRPAGHAVHVDGSEQVAAGSETTWQAALDLAEGANSFLFESVDPTGNAEDSETVDIELDSIAPTVVARVPSPDATDVPINVVLQVTFSEPIDCDTVTPAVFAIQGVSAALECNPDDPSVSLTPDSHLSETTEYTVTLFSDVADPAGNLLARDVVWMFTTGTTVDTTPPDPPTADDPAPPQYTFDAEVTVGGWKEAGCSVISNGTEIVPLDDLESWNHSFVLQAGPNTFSLTSEDQAGNLSSSSTDFTVTRTSGTFSVDSYPDLTNATPATVSGTKPNTYGVRVDGVERVPADDQTTWTVGLDLSEGANTFLFEPVDPAGQAGAGVTVFITLDTRTPTLVARVPGDGATDVPVNTAVQAVFDEPIDCASVDDSTIALRPTDVATRSVDCDSAGGAVTWTGAGDLTGSTAYTVTVSAGVTDLAGNWTGADASWGFTTGQGVDITPPPPPTVEPAPEASTYDESIVLGGWKEAGSSVLDYGTLIVPNDALDSWQYTFPLAMGDNISSLTSKDAAGNESETSTDFAIERLDPNAVDPPTVNYAADTTVDRQTLTGTKPQDTAILIDDAVVVPINGSTDWDALVLLAPGANGFKIEARDQPGFKSSPVNITITYTVPPQVDTNGEIKIELEVQSAWKHIGDEFRVGSPDRTIIDAFAVQVWIEGPLTVMDDQGTADPTDDSWEPCIYDANAFQRKYTRYVKTLKRHVYQGCLDIYPPDQCYGYWWEPNFWAPNWFAAVVELGHWNTPATPAGRRIPPDVDRRDDEGHSWWWSGSGPCPPVHFWNGANCQPRMTQPPAIDGLTEATVAPRHDGFTYPYPATRGSGPNGVGALVGEWTDQRQYTWNLRDIDGNPVRQGAYLVSVSIVLDRALEGNIHWPNAEATDHETCWDDPGHDDVGMHRAEGVIVIDSQTPQAVYWQEKGTVEYVDACSSPNLNIWCDGHIDFTISGDYEAAYETPDPPCSLPGDRVRHLATPAGWPAPVKIQYCPAGACP